MRTPQRVWRPKAQPTQPTSIDTPAPTSKTRPPTQQEENQDYWGRQGEHWIRHHLVPRTTVFILSLVQDTHQLTHLSLNRTTITTNNFNEVKQHKDNWTTADNTHLPYTWTGTTRLTVKEGYHYIDDNVLADDEPHVEAQRAKALPTYTTGSS